jgi:hypothetical protein
MSTQEKLYPYRGEYKVTGRYAYGGQFKAIHTNNIIHALSINLWKGTVWYRVNGKWTVVRRVP